MHEGLPQCFLVNNFTDTERENALRRMSEASDNLLLSYADWTKMGAVNGHGQAGTWNAQRGPPYVDRLTMFVGAGATLRRLCRVVPARLRCTDVGRWVSQAWTRWGMVISCGGLWG